MKHWNCLIKTGGYPVGKPHMKGMFDRKSGIIISGPNEWPPAKRYRVRFRKNYRDKKEQIDSNTWFFSPQFIKLA